MNSGRPPKGGRPKNHQQGRTASINTPVDYLFTNGHRTIITKISTLSMIHNAQMQYDQAILCAKHHNVDACYEHLRA